MTDPDDLTPEDHALLLAADAERLRAIRPRDPDPIPAPGDGLAALGGVLDSLARLAPAAAEDDRTRRRLAHRRREALRALAVERGVPEDDDLRAVALDDAAPETPAIVAVRQALAWRGDARRGMVLVLGGSPGAGKSAAAAHALLRYDGSSLWVSAVEVGATPRNGYSEHEHLWSRWSTAQLLVVDDAGCETSAPEVMTGLLALRYDRGRATVCTTNLARKVFAARYLSGDVGARLADRLIHAQGRAVTVDGRRTIGPRGLGWYAACGSVSLRSVEARAALRGGR